LVIAVVLPGCSSSGTRDPLPPDGSHEEPPPHKALGDVESWQPAAPLPTARANHCSASIGDYVLAIGGNHKQADGSFVKTDEIHAAKVSADGTLGAWQLAGRTASPASECTATSDGRHLYILDGLYDRDTDARKVWAADLDDTGMLGPLVTMTTLPRI